MKLKVQNITAIALLSLMIVSCGELFNKDADTQEEEVKKNVKIELAAINEIDQSNEYTGVILSNSISKIMPAIPGRIRKILVEVGDEVKKGQTLVVLDDANLSQQKTRLENLEIDYARFQELYSVGGISKQQLDQLEAQLIVARSSYQSINENTTLISPTNGVVTARNFEDGDMVAQIPILVIENYNPVKVLINLEEVLFAQIKKGKEVFISLDVYPDKEFVGKVSLIHPTISMGSHTFSVEVSIPNNDLQIRPGMFARVKLPLGTNERILLSDIAIIKRPGSNNRFVYVLENGLAITRDVILGKHIGEKYEIISGISAGDTVITMGASRISENDKVNIIK